MSRASNKNPKSEECDCVEDLTIQAHSNPQWFDIRGRRYKKVDKETKLEEFGENAVDDGKDPKAFTRITEKNATQFADVLKETICFCKPCIIWLLGCNVGLGDIPGDIAKETKCTVKAPKGYVGTMAIPNNPKVARIQKTWGEKYPEHPGATGDFGTFKPPDADKK